MVPCAQVLHIVLRLLVLRGKVVVLGAIGAILDRLVIFFSCLLLMGFIVRWFEVVSGAAPWIGIAMARPLDISP